MGNTPLSLLSLIHISFVQRGPARHPQHRAGVLRQHGGQRFEHGMQVFERVVALAEQQHHPPLLPLALDRLDAAKAEMETAAAPEPSPEAPSPALSLIHISQG